MVDVKDEEAALVEVVDVGPSFRHTLRHSLATWPSGSSRAAFVTRMHITATMAATDDESAPPAS